MLYVQDPRDDNVGHFMNIKSIPARELATEKKEHRKYFCNRYSIKVCNKKAKFLC